MWTYETSVVWKEKQRGETHGSGKPPVEVAMSPELGGPPNIWTPADLLTSAVASSIMTSTLFFAEKSGIELRSYMSNASGVMEKTSGGRTITRIAVEIAITLSEAGQGPAIRKAVERAERTCPISNALRCPVEVVLHLSGAGPVKKTEVTT